MNFPFVMPEPSHSGGGGGPDDEQQYEGHLMRMQGFIALVFGMALGLTLMILFLIFRWNWISSPTAGVRIFVNGTWWNLLSTFTIGFISGTMFAAFHNLLIFRRTNLFGLDRRKD